ncbi:LysR family transcriptional regulator [Ideonella oryzae]|uniref:LysR family transcriptional regulator n=1 Tax=Ideonella oryzae TaxID=2937441 RepID=A0ABT1BHN2_9BURK|nr:LysR family transcriptional regulator [Ideonella oryzae]MCO5975598.1 LysR family transcriptional regulator [Ideonella oryzae]
MELRHIRYFLAVAAEGNFTRAAERLGIGQPPLSQQIRDLENEVGARLFHRVPQGAVLTEAGQAFLDKVADMPAQAATAVHHARQAARGETGILRLGFTASAILLPRVTQAIRAFRRAFAQVELQLEENNSALLAQRLREGRLDLAFLRPDGAEARDLTLHALPDEPMIAALPAGHALLQVRRKTLRLTDLRDEWFILTPRPIGATLHDAVVGACRQAGFEPRLGPHAPQLSSALALVAAETGVTVVPASMGQFALAGVEYRPLAGVQPIARLALAHRRKLALPQVGNFLALARDASLRQ